MEQRHHQFEKHGSRKAAAESKPASEPPRNCPRCESTNTKFCYYNNYSSSQPRYFCRACRRYWTQGGALRNLPHGSSAARRAAKHSKRTSSTSYSAASTSNNSVIMPLHHEMSTGVARTPWCFNGGGVLRQPMAYGGVDPSSLVVGNRNLPVLPEMAGVLNSGSGEEGDRSLGNLFGGLEDGSSCEGGARRITSASSGPFI